VRIATLTPQWCKCRIAGEIALKLPEPDAAKAEAASRFPVRRMCHHVPIRLPYAAQMAGKNMD
jgi:hypothetical protein